MQSRSLQEVSHESHMISDAGAPRVSKIARLGWIGLEMVYSGALIYNLSVQDSESWSAYAFRLTQAGAWMTWVQHLFHPHSPVRESLMKFAERCKIGYGRWKCIKDDSYSHAEGLSNLALTSECLIPILYWGLAFRLDKVEGPADYVNTVFMHGLISLALLVDYFVNNRSYHLRHTLVNLTFFLGLYMAWNLAGQKAQKDPVYPVIDWEADPLFVLVLFGVALASALFISGALKCSLSVREKGCKAGTAQAFSCIKSEPVVEEGSYEALP